MQGVNEASTVGFVFRQKQAVEKRFAGRNSASEFDVSPFYLEVELADKMPEGIGQTGRIGSGFRGG